MSEFVWIGLYIGLGVLCILIVDLSLRLLNARRLTRQDAVALELTPPAQTGRTPEANQRLFTVLHGLYTTQPFMDKFLRRAPVFSLEVISTREDGIRYIMRVPERQMGFFEQAIVSYLPSVRTRLVEDYLPKKLHDGTVQVLEFKQTGHFAYPLQAQSSIHASDPISYLSGMMTKLDNGELISFQLVVSPTKVRKADAIAQRLMNNEELLQSVGKRRTPIAQGVNGLIGTLLFGILDLVGDIFHGSSSSSNYSSQREAAHRHDVAARIKPARVLGAFEQELAESVNDKVRQQLYAVSIRAVVVMKDEAARAQRIEGLKSAMGVLSIPGYQSLKTRHDIPKAQMQRYRSYMLRHRLLPFRPSRATILSASELATMYHFPTSATHKTENVVTSHSKTLPATIDLKRHADGGEFATVLGKNSYHGTVTEIGLTSAERERHVYIVGGTGSGKTTMLEYSIVQDIRGGRGVAVIDPHGDMAKKLLKYIPAERIDDVIYFNPRDIDYPIGMNLLELAPGLAGSELEFEKDRVTEAVVSVLRKVFSEDDSGGHRIEYVLRNTIHTAMTVEDATIFTVLRLLTESAYRKKIVKTLEDEDLKSFWKEELGKAGEMQRVKMSAGVTNKLGRFRRSVAAERILSQPKSTIDFDDILNSGKILICNLSKGLGEDTSSLFGTAILAKLQLAAWRREELDPEDRPPFYVYVDEFQNFATMPFLQMLSESRKYKLFLTMAEQSTAQQEKQRMVETILANVGTVICFRSGSPADERYMLPFFSPYIDEGEINNMPAYNFYIRVGGLKPQEPMSGETIVLSDGDKATATSVISASRVNYATKYKAKSEQPDNRSSAEASGDIQQLEAAFALPQDE